MSITIIPTSDRWLTAHDAMAMLGLSKGGMQHLRRTRRLRFKRESRWCWYRESSVRAEMARRGVAA